MNSSLLSLKTSTFLCWYASITSFLGILSGVNPSCNSRSWSPSLQPGLLRGYTGFVLWRDKLHHLSHFCIFSWHPLHQCAYTFANHYTTCIPLQIHVCQFIGCLVLLKQLTAFKVAFSKNVSGLITIFLKMHCSSPLFVSFISVFEKNGYELISCKIESAPNQ